MSRVPRLDRGAADPHADAVARAPASPGALGTASRGGMQRYPVVGGATAWRLPLLTGMVALAGLVLDVWGIAASVVVLGWVGQLFWRSVVIELSPDGLARGLRLDGVFVGPPVSMAWSAVVAVDTDWWEPEDHRALETTVRSRDGTTIRISTAMGLRSYWACLAEIVRRAPGARRSGLTDGALASGPPARRDVVAAAWTAGALALILGAMIGLGYALSQGRSSLSRDLDETAALPREGCHPGARIEGAGPTTACRPTAAEEGVGPPSRRHPTRSGILP